MSEIRPKPGHYVWHEPEEFTRGESYVVRFGDRDEYRERRGWTLARCWTAEDAAVCASALRAHFEATLAPPRLPEPTKEVAR